MGKGVFVISYGLLGELLNIPRNSRIYLVMAKDEYTFRAYAISPDIPEGTTTNPMTIKPTVFKKPEEITFDWGIEKEAEDE